MNWDGDENLKEGEDRKIYYEERKSNQRKDNNVMVVVITQEVQFFLSE